MALDRLDKCGHSVTVQGFDFWLLRPGELAGIGGIDTEMTNFHGLLEGFVKDTMNNLDRFRGKPWASLDDLTDALNKAVEASGFFRQMEEEKAPA